MFRPRHYHANWTEGDNPSRYQIDDDLQERVIRHRKSKPVIPESIQRLAHAEYEKQHPGQNYERMQQRGGLSILEIVRLLADHVERLGGKPSEPRKIEPT
jgi:hypothetical protein